MKTLFISTAIFLAVTSLSSAAFANANGINSDQTKVCQSTSTKEPTGGATVQRLNSMHGCNPGERKFYKSSDARICPSVPIAEPSGGATRERLQAMQQCNK